MAQEWVTVLGLALITVSILLFVAAALHDVAARTVPNGLALALALTGVAARALDHTLIAGLIAGFVIFALAAFCWRRGWMGGGDVKLMGAGAMAVPPGGVVNFILVMSIAGALLAVVYLIGRSMPAPPPSLRPASLPARALRIERWRLHRGGPLPYACAIAAGGLFVLF